MGWSGNPCGCLTIYAPGHQFFLCVFARDTSCHTDSIFTFHIQYFPLGGNL